MIASSAQAWALDPTIADVIRELLRRLLAWLAAHTDATDPADPDDIVWP